MDSDRKLSDTIVGKSARACDSCIKKRARWYCAADDAFLCQSCDSSVHSANSLARRHERVLLKSASIHKIKSEPSNWHQGFTRKARTPRHKKNGKAAAALFSNTNHPLPLVPEINNSSEEKSNEEENEEQLLYRVPIFEPVSDFITHEANTSERNILAPPSSSGMDLDEFAECLLGKGMDDFHESFNNMEGLGFLDDCDDENGGRGLSSNELFWLSDESVKVEENHHQIEVEFDMGRETFELNFDFDYSPTRGEEQEQEEEEIAAFNNFENFAMENYEKTLLKLDYGGVMSAWDKHKSPWTTGERPPEPISGCHWPEFSGACGTMGVNGETGKINENIPAAATGDGGREARVSRYREKRRKRLFSKKIRYEVRKLNAEKRPRMKGRFVKRANLEAPAFSLLNT
ncbi:hypothetical protein ABFS82_05G033000 [Erythranthe guttata]|uniref:CCT domain-containing protein n=1 Tax=Erythranthe guttata TaxID=4155 RepID=A0A022QRT9_ERYGU|nr:PREDICTED: zinc finger protein CONSTANS-LIKE 16-like [Erythranthe guttata]EYU29978.1 hypothetical protein MIMGU_mgv1a007591mg [Erythranthe guttata]|eukprot:XP_012846230.1 PREDICTED: zinc finger protein CONSTANS-LIKE 16-like [Erythranthe guttata]